MSKILVTGGAGFIGSHTVVELQQNDYEVIIVDNFSNSDEKSIERIEDIIGVSPIFYQIDITDSNELNTIFEQHADIEAVIHFAAFKAVGESVHNPLSYYHNNLGGLMNLLASMNKFGVNKLIFSSSATVYGEPDKCPIEESDPRKDATSPYGNTKRISEDMIYDQSVAHQSFNAISLRYFNPVGAHESGLMGELPQGAPNNLMPYITQTAAGIRKELSVFGGDYPTPDGTCLRDYIHVVDLAEAHVKALERLLNNNNETPYEIINLGTGKGNSVLEVIAAFERSNGVKVPYRIVDRRAGDVASVYASTALANEKLGWKTKRDLDQMTKDAWRWECHLRDKDFGYISTNAQ